MLLIERIANKSLLLIVLSLASSIGFAQERCGTVEYTKKLKDQGFIPQNDKAFEDWVLQKTLQRQSSRSQRTKSTFKVPVVVHVIHNGEAIGSGTNISNAQILSQISVLNEDFNRLNPDAGSTPAEFVSLAGNMDIEFVLAKQDQEGLSTTGILRVQGPKSEWSINDNYQLKELSYWPAEDYLNIWVCNITDFLGYTQFPESSLPGLENSSTNRLTDGPVIWHRAFGSIDDGAFNLDPDYNKGRTTTHEMGHFFGLRHIWGDDGGACGGNDDYVPDTPDQAGNTNGCPTHPKSDNCTAVKMFQNYLDYSDDQCMNLFTKDQVSRMITVLQNSPRRASLLTSHGLSDPVPVPNDLGIKEILTPLPTECSNTLIPKIEIKNYGSNSVSSARIRLIVDGVEAEVKDFTLNNLAFLQSAEVTFSSKTLSTGSHSISFQILQTNGVTDVATQNNLLSTTFFIPELGTAPFSENFNTMPAKWVIQNPDLQITWQQATAIKDTPDNIALLLNFFDYEDSYGELDIFLSPVFDLSAVPVASLAFDVAHARFQGSNDQLKVIVLKNCESILNGTTVYDKIGSVLATAPSTGQPFFPSGESQWRKELVNVSQFVGETHVQFAFVGVNDWGNNLFVDNISLLTSELEDLELKEMSSPSLVTCDDQPAPRIVVQNLGTVTINDFNVEYAINNGSTQTFQVNGLSLASGEEMEVDLPQVNLTDGVNSIFINITQPNGNADVTPSNNQRNFVVAVNKASDRIPLRENFDQPFEVEWTAINPSGGMDWQSTSTNYKTSVYFNSFNNTNVGDEAWLVSPVLDFSGAITASMVFDISRAIRFGRAEQLRILASIDCGNTYSEVNTFLSTVDESFSAWVPKEESDWQKDVVADLNTFAGQKEVRIAFVITNENGNNVFLDNIEFFTTDPNAIPIADIYSIYGYSSSDLKGSDLKITFNLSERQNVHYSIVDRMGKTYAEGLLPDILNQTYPLEIEENLTPGIYIVRLKIGNQYFSDKVLIGK